tara:strand:+ start:327 stop:767 length:441 start_codon:yes stop_codon:yes gene_type:complete
MKMGSEIRKMVDSVANKNINSFAKRFDSAIKDRIGLKIDDKRGGISSTLLNKPSSTSEIEPEINFEESAEATRRLVHSLQFVSENNEGVVLELMNGDKVDLLPKDAKLITDVHDILTEENQVDFRNNVMKDKESFNSMIEFSKENN